MDRSLPLLDGGVDGVLFFREVMDRRILFRSWMDGENNVLLYN